MLTEYQDPWKSLAKRQEEPLEKRQAANSATEVTELEAGTESWMKTKISLHPFCTSIPKHQHCHSSGGRVQISSSFWAVMQFMLIYAALGEHLKVHPFSPGKSSGEISTAP